MKELVESHRGKVFCDSQMVADKFERRHPYVIQVIEKLIADVTEIKGDNSCTLNFTIAEREYRGQKFKVYLMDRQSFSLLSMKFTGANALEWQIKFNEAFYLMEKQLLIEATNKGNAAWVTQRKQGIEARKAEADTIKLFVDYAKEQGSSNPQWYYKHVTKACYRCLQLIESEKPKLRDTLDTMQLSQLMMAEHIAEKSIRKHMDSGEHYKAIFSLVKADLEKFADAMMIEKPKQLPKKGGK